MEDATPRAIRKKTKKTKKLMISSFLERDRSFDVPAALEEIKKGVRIGYGMIGTIDEERSWQWAAEETIVEDEEPASPDEEDPKGTKRRSREQLSGPAKSQRTGHGRASDDSDDSDEADNHGMDTLDFHCREHTNRIHLGPSDSEESSGDEVDQPIFYTAGSANKQQRDQDIGDFESGKKFGRDFIEVGDNFHVHIYDFFCDKHKRWDQLINDLFAVQPLSVPNHMTIEPTDYQLKEAAQLHFLCEGNFRGGLLGNPPGIGKTLSGVLTMYLARQSSKQLGLSVVVCPKPASLQWHLTIQRSWEEGHGMKSLMLEDSSVTAEELLAGGYDVVIVSFEFLSASAARLRKYPEDLDNYLALSDAQRAITPMPKRPTCAILGPYWQKTNRPFFRVIIDEAQKVNKASGDRHKAVKNIFTKARVCLSGTLAHDKWHDFGGLVSFLHGHPFTDLRKFTRAFGSNGSRNDRPPDRKLKFLQKFLQAFTIIKPASVVKLEKSTSRTAYFRLSNVEATAVASMTSEYRRLSAMKRSKKPTIQGKDRKAKKDDATSIHLAVKAQAISLHPMMFEKCEAQQVKSDGGDFNDIDAQFLVDGKRRSKEEDVKWKQEIEARENLIEESSRLKWFLKLWEMVQKEYPGEKVLVFSLYRTWLDIIEVALKQKYGIEALRYDGDTPQSRRKEIERDFAAGPSDVPLLLTAGAGGVALNLQMASVVIRTEVWWNLSNEKHAVKRADRKGQMLEVKDFRMEGYNSAICAEIKRVQLRKDCINRELYSKLVRDTDEGPADLDIADEPHFYPIQFNTSPPLPLGK